MTGAVVTRSLAIAGFAASAVCWPVGVVVGAWTLVVRGDVCGALPLAPSQVLAVATFGVALANLV